MQRLHDPLGDHIDNRASARQSGIRRRVIFPAPTASAGFHQHKRCNASAPRPASKQALSHLATASLKPRAIIASVEEPHRTASSPLDDGKVDVPDLGHPRSYLCIAHPPAMAEIGAPCTSQDNIISGPPSHSSRSGIPSETTQGLLLERRWPRPGGSAPAGRLFLCFQRRRQPGLCQNRIVTLADHRRASSSPVAATPRRWLQDGACQITARAAGLWSTGQPATSGASGARRNSCPISFVQPRPMPYRRGGGRASPSGPRAIFFSKMVTMPNR